MIATIESLPDDSTMLAMPIAKDLKTPKSVVYFLIQNNEIIYVGASSSLIRRISRHASAAKIDKEHFFDSVAFIDVDQSRMLEIEKEWIEKLNTKLNGKKCSIHTRGKSRVEFVAEVIQVKKWEKAAERHGLALSGWIRQALIAAAADQKQQGAK